MRLIDYLDSLNWTQTRLAEEAHISTSTIGRVIQEKTISRKNADAICSALSRGMGRKVEIKEVNEIHVTRAERPERRKSKQEKESTESGGSVLLNQDRGFQSGSST